jgi:hypothetical protein
VTREEGRSVRLCSSISDDARGQIIVSWIDFFFSI